MTDPANTTRPQDRLVASRRALVQHMTHGEGAANQAERRSNGQARGEDEGGETYARSEPIDHSIWHKVKRALEVWWNHHPAQLALDLAKPALQTYARHQPLKLLLIAAGAGAALVVIRPWRLASLTGVALATLKSSGLPSALLSLFSSYSQSTAPSKDQS